MKLPSSITINKQTAMHVFSLENHSYTMPLQLLAYVLATAVFSLFLLASCPTPSYSQTAEDNTTEFSSVEERRLFDAIQKERASIHEQKKEIELRKKELKSIEESVDKKLVEIDTKLDEMKALRKQIETLLAAKSEEELKRTQDLAKIYEKMSPVKAALAISGLEPGLAADLLASMKVKAAAKILDQSNQQKATELSTTFSTIQLE